MEVAVKSSTVKSLEFIGGLCILSGIILAFSNSSTVTDYISEYFDK
ncbi:hypothetical protein [Amphibacillus cookii]|nr:hypothetical protein [Amphibacillus cookii]MBM7541822.1 hypothetical protein [Amphibacillus cookii]